MSICLYFFPRISLNSVVPGVLEEGINTADVLLRVDKFLSFYEISTVKKIYYRIKNVLTLAVTVISHQSQRKNTRGCPEERLRPKHAARWSSATSICIA